MEISTHVAPTPRMPVRALGVVALILVLIAATVAVYVGQQRRAPAPPFGLASNGVVAYSTDGEIVVVDPDTGEATAIVSGDDADLRPVFSPDGSLVAFARQQLEPGQIAGGNAPVDVLVARADGSAPVKVTSEPLRLATSDVAHAYEFSPDGTQLAIAATHPDGRPGILLASVDGSGSDWLDLGAVADDVATITEPSFRPVDGAEIMFVGIGGSMSRGPGIYAYDMADGQIRTILEAPANQGMDLARWSPDGTRLSYATWSNEASGLSVRTHVVNADGTGDIELPMPAGADWQVGGAWSNDSSQIHVVRGDTLDWTGSQPVIMPADGSDPGRVIPYEGTIQGGCCYAWSWSPDDTMVLGQPIDPSGRPQPHVIIDVASGTISQAPWTAIGFPVWQRVAP
jgi:dipeptidyl aminopeptidase/acylaminoacyl peptidase